MLICLTIIATLVITLLILTLTLPYLSFGFSFLFVLMTSYAPVYIILLVRCNLTCLTRNTKEISELKENLQARIKEVETLKKDKDSAAKGESSVLADKTNHVRSSQISNMCASFFKLRFNHFWEMWPTRQKK
jgi:hypothetical protein